MWRLNLICCGRADGHIVREHWDEANQFRHDYCDPPPPRGHDRQGILERDFAHLYPCNGYSKDCPLSGGTFLVNVE
jgi:hypothetical protein